MTGCHHDRRGAQGPGRADVVVAQVLLVVGGRRVALGIADGRVVVPELYEEVVAGFDHVVDRGQPPLLDERPRTAAADGTVGDGDVRGEVRGQLLAPPGLRE